MKFIILLFVISAHFSTYFSQTTLILQPDAIHGKDALLSNVASEENMNYGENHQFVADAWLFTGLPGVIRSIIEFDYSSLPNDAIISNASLSFYGWDATSQLGQHATTSGPNNSYLERITTSWNESSVSWNSQPNTTTLNRLSIPESTSSVQNYIDMDVTTLFQDMIANPGSSFGFMIKLQNEAYYRRMNFCSSDHSNPALRPKLTITYTAESSLTENKNDFYSVYPNPSSHVINILFENKNHLNLVVNVYNTLGDKVKSEMIFEKNYQINIADLSNGIYTLEVCSDSGSTFQKLIIQN